MICPVFGPVYIDYNIVPYTAVQETVAELHPPPK
jgi:hypothetical protein